MSHNKHWFWGPGGRIHGHVASRWARATDVTPEGLQPAHPSIRHV